jgi:hypothetical protein
MMEITETTLKIVDTGIPEKSHCKPIFIWLSIDPNGKGINKSLG